MAGGSERARPIEAVCEFIIFSNLPAARHLSGCPWGCSTRDDSGAIWPKSFRKEVIQPQVPLRLPCYDLVPITEFIFGTCVLAVRSATSDAPRFRGLTGGVYKAQEHIHRRNADRRLLAIPASCRRVAACNPYWGTLFAISVVSRLSGALYAPL